MTQPTTSTAEGTRQAPAPPHEKPRKVLTARGWTAIGGTLTLALTLWCWVPLAIWLRESVWVWLPLISGVAFGLGGLIGIAAALIEMKGGPFMDERPE